MIKSLVYSIPTWRIYTALILNLVQCTKFTGQVSIYCAFAPKWGVVLKSISTPPFSRRWELFSKIGSRGTMGNRIPHGTTRANFWKKFSSSRKRGGADFFPGLYGGLYGQNLPYKFKKSYGDFRNRNFEKSHRTIHRTTGPRSNLRPDLWSWENSGLDTTSRIFENWFFWVTTRAN